MCSFRCVGYTDVDASIILPTQPLFGISTPRDLYSWLVADEGLMRFLAPPSNSSLFGQALPQLNKPDGRVLPNYFITYLLSDDSVLTPTDPVSYIRFAQSRSARCLRNKGIWSSTNCPLGAFAGQAYQQLVLYNWNSSLTTRSVRVLLALRQETSFPIKLGFSCESLQCEYQPVFEAATFKGFLKKLADGNVLRDTVEELTLHIVLVNRNHINMLLEACIKFYRNRGGSISPNLYVEAFSVSPYASTTADKYKMHARTFKEFP